MKNKKSWKEFSKLKGSLPPDSMEILKNERKIDEKWEKEKKNSMKIRKN